MYSGASMWLRTILIGRGEECCASYEPPEPRPQHLHAAVPAFLGLDPTTPKLIPEIDLGATKH